MGVRKATKSNEDYIDEETKIPYISDKGLIDTGIIKTVSSDSPANLRRYAKNLRSFPQGTRNCYTLRPEQGKNNNYLIRAVFAYGNYDGENQILLKAGQQRELKINLNGERYLSESVKLDYLKPQTIVQNDRPVSGERIYFSISAAEGTTLPPILNAVEIFVLKELPNKPTSIDDGSVPEALLQKFRSGKLVLSVGENPDLCLSVPWKRMKKKEFVVPIVASSVAVVMVLLFIFSALVIYKRKRKGDMVTKSNFKSKNQQYSYSEVVSITSNFRTIIGGGGFGKVYRGKLKDENQVAVKCFLLHQTKAVRNFEQRNFNKKSDVYSFGIILFELITCRTAIVRGPVKYNHILDRVTPLIERGDIQNIVDPRLEGEFNTNSACKAIEIAMSCIPSYTIQRPDMSHVLAELKECLALEMDHGRTQRIANEGNLTTSSIPFKMTHLEYESDVAPHIR
ncbi:putative lrr receptor-like serine/threonine-protein kinase [Quercus suber]|uniref:Lrr receptor-like serine/threonine-protein kinase n=1 Tax=Quercus suber TaxID=58331 RepID=A0AAW0JBE1_QUESU